MVGVFNVRGGRPVEQVRNCRASPTDGCDVPPWSDRQGWRGGGGNRWVPVGVYPCLRLVPAGRSVYEVDLSGWVAIALLGAIVIGGLWWAYLVSQGVRFRPILLGVLSAGYVLLFFTVETGNWLGVDGVAPFDLGLLAVVGVVAYLISIRSTCVLYNRQGELGYREDPILVIVWLLLLLVEIYVQQSILGEVTVFQFVVVRGIPSPTPVDPSTLSDPVRVVVTTVDALFAMSTGVALGDNAALYSAFARARLKRAHRG